MQKTITISDLLLYIYGETDKKNEHSISAAILTNEKLNNTWSELNDITAILDSIDESPSDECINKIMNYSRVFSSFEYSKTRFTTVLN